MAATGRIGRWLAPGAVALAVAGGACGAPCPAEDFTTQVSATSECLVMRRYGPPQPKVLAVWLHGNVSTGGPANSHFRAAEKMALDFVADRVLAVALVRPGYPDGTGASSTGNDQGRADNWPRATVEEIGVAIDRLRQRYRPESLVLIGHSGGAAIAAALLGAMPRLAEAAILVGCPCDMTAWRAGRRGPSWTSEDPLRWAARTPVATRVLALTGDADATTPASLARAYVAALQAGGVEAEFRSLPGVGHIDILHAPAIAAAFEELLRR